MKVSSYLDTKPTQELPGVVKREVINADDGAPNFCMRVFDVEPGGGFGRPVSDFGGDTNRRPGGFA